jgi:UDP-3-O-[3-hydroxymyristoyl] glucosamine N-acyltransferase LpxD
MTDYLSGEILHFLISKGKKCTLSGRENRVWNHATPISNSNGESVCFVRPNSVLSDALAKRLRGVVILPSKYLTPIERSILLENDVTFIESEESEVDYFLVLRHFLKEELKKSLEQTSICEQGLILPHNYSIGAMSYIARDVILGENIRVGVGCVIRNCTIGENVEIQDGVNIGSDALGAVKDKSGKWIDRPSMAGVIIEKDCRIEANTVIQRGFLQHTHIHENVRIGPNSWIGNGVTVGSGGLVAQSVVIAGSVTVGRNTKLWGNCSIREGIRIVDDVIVGMGSVVVSDLIDAGVYVGNPARKLTR